MSFWKFSTKGCTTLANQYLRKYSLLNWVKSRDEFVTKFFVYNNASVTRTNSKSNGPRNSIVDAENRKKSDTEEIKSKSDSPRDFDLECSFLEFDKEARVQTNIIKNSLNNVKTNAKTGAFELYPTA